MKLAIDTATNEAGVTIVMGEQAFYLPFEGSHYADNILVLIDQLLENNGKKVEDITQVFATVGPGSFTGLRIGISIANQFAHQLKIPIVGLKTDEWWAHRTDETDYVYLQTLNKQEVYTPEGLLLIGEVKGDKWLGQVSQEHRAVIHGLHEITEILSPAETWKKVIADFEMKAREKYDLLVPFYGKEPTITQSKKPLSI